MSRPSRRDLLKLGGAALAVGFSPGRAQARDRLTPFYRSMQLQGSIPRHGLEDCPAYLKTPGAYLFERANPARTAIPFVDSFSITRFLGGYRQEWLAQLDNVDPALGPGALDYAVQKNGRLEYRPDVVQNHLSPYLKAGYSASDITIVLDNTPWALARGGGSLGPYGQNNPPRDIAAWSDMLRALCRDLKATLGGGAPGFKVGNEYDTKKSFQGDAKDYFELYAASFEILREAFPHSEIAPGEFTRNGHCAPSGDAVCVYDTGAFLTQARARGMAPAYVPRSLNGFLDTRVIAPSEVARRAALSYRGLGGVTPEIHQFGLLGQPFGPYQTFGSDQGPRRAAWEFITLMHLREQLRPRRVFHWDPFFALAKTNFALLNGCGFVRLLLDQYEGAEVELAPVTPAQRDDVETLGAILSQSGRLALALASFAPGEAAPAKVEARLSTSKALDWRFVRLGADNDVFAAIKADLDKAGNLKPEFKGNIATAEPPHMAVDPHAARRMLLESRARYEALALEALKWRPVSALPYRLQQAGALISLDMPANEVLLLEAAV